VPHLKFPTPGLTQVAGFARNLAEGAGSVLTSTLKGTSAGTGAEAGPPALPPHQDVPCSGARLGLGSGGSVAFRLNALVKRGTTPRGSLPGSDRPITTVAMHGPIDSPEQQAKFAKQATILRTTEVASPDELIYAHSFEGPDEYGEPAASSTYDAANHILYGKDPVDLTQPDSLRNVVAESLPHLKPGEPKVRTNDIFPYPRTNLPDGLGSKELIADTLRARAEEITNRPADFSADHKSTFLLSRQPGYRPNLKDGKEAIKKVLGENAKVEVAVHRSKPEPMEVQGFGEKEGKAAALNRFVSVQTQTNAAD
jgi:hypothetical protein